MITADKRRSCVYVLRPPLAQSRLHTLHNGLGRITLKRAFSDGTFAIDLDPLSLLCRLAAAVPAPGFDSVRYAGVLAPAARWRPLVIAQPRARGDAGQHTHPQHPADDAERHPGSLGCGRRDDGCCKQFFERFGEPGGKPEWKGRRLLVRPAERVRSVVTVYIRNESAGRGRCQGPEASIGGAGKRHHDPAAWARSRCLGQHVSDVWLDGHDDFGLSHGAAAPIH